MSCCTCWRPATISMTVPRCRPPPKARSIANRYAAAPGFASAQVGCSFSPPAGSSSRAATTLAAGASVSHCLILAVQHPLSWFHQWPTGLPVSLQDTCASPQVTILFRDCMCAAGHLDCRRYSGYHFGPGCKASVETCASTLGQMTMPHCGPVLVCVLQVTSSVSGAVTHRTA